MTYLRNSAGQIVLIFGIRYEFKVCNVLTVTFHDWALNFHWFHLFRNKGKDAQKGQNNNNILILTRQVADHSRFQAVPLIPIPPTEPGIRMLLDSSAVPNSGTKPANFDSLTDFHVISVQNL